MNNSTDQRLREIAERENKATNGPWESEQNRDWCEWRVVNNSEDCCRPIISSTEQPERDYFDAEFIAHSRQDVPWLLALIKKQREALEFYGPQGDFDLGNYELKCAEDGGQIARDALNFSPE